LVSFQQVDSAVAIMGCNSSTSKSQAGKTLLNSTNLSKGKHEGSRPTPVAKVVSEAQVMQYTPTEEEEEEEEKPQATRKTQRKVTPWHVAPAVNMDDEDDEEEEAKEDPKEPDPTESEQIRRNVKRKATPWAKVPVADDEDEDEDAAEAEEKEVMPMTTPELPAVKLSSADGGANFCLFTSCQVGSCCGQDAQTELVLSPEKM